MQNIANTFQSILKHVQKHKVAKVPMDCGETELAAVGKLLLKHVT